MASRIEKTFRLFLCAGWKEIYPSLDKALIAAFGLFLFNNVALAQADVYLKLSTSERQPLELAVAGLRPGQAANKKAVVSAQKFLAIVKDDLDFSLYFRIIEAPEEDYGFKKGRIEPKAWQLLGAKMVLVPQLISRRAADSLWFQIYDLGIAKAVASWTVPVTAERSAAHRLADRIIKQLTGENGIASTKIAFCLKEGENKELAAMDYDGHNLVKLTGFKSLNLSPDWSPDGQNLAFLSYIRNRTEIYELDLGSMTTKRLSEAEGLNASPAYSPDGSNLALTLSQDGNAEIYVMDLKSGLRRRLTNNWAIDCSPSWSPNGREIAFVSDRAGRPQIYIMDADGGNLRRLTYEGGYNTSPAWSPRGDRIAFVSRIEGRFQICTISASGQGLAQLTFEGDNEDPSWSPDGLHLVFSSNRTGQSQIWLMHYDGSGQRAVTSGSAATMPAWGPTAK